MRELCIELLNERGVELEDIVDCVIYLQKEFLEVMDRDVIIEDIMGILSKESTTCDFNWNHHR